MDHTCAAQTGAATKFCAGELQSFADHPQQRRIGRRIRRRGSAIHKEVRCEANLAMGGSVRSQAYSRLWRALHPEARLPCRIPKRNDVLLHASAPQFNYR
jgi:hypothetical protein